MTIDLCANKECPLRGSCGRLYTGDRLGLRHRIKVVVYFPVVAGRQVSCAHFLDSKYRVY